LTKTPTIERHAKVLTHAHARQELNVGLGFLQPGSSRSIASTGGTPVSARRSGAMRLSSFG
jgi:hypothetical protein